MSESASLHITEKESAVLRQAPLFAGIRQEEIPKLLPCLAAARKTFEKDAAIFSIGEKIIRVGLVLSGSVRIERYDCWGNRHIVTAVLPGDLFGEAYAAAAQPSGDIGVTAAEPSTVLFLDLSRMLHMCKNACPYHARLIDNLVCLLASKNLALNEKLTCVTQPTLRDKLLSYLSSQSLRQHSAYFDIPFDRQALADYLNAERSALSNEISKLRREGILECRKNHFHLLVPAGSLEEEGKRKR